MNRLYASLVSLGVVFANTVITGFQNGVFLTTTSGPDQASVRSSTIAHCSGVGIQVDGGSAAVNNTIVLGANGSTGISLSGGSMSRANNIIFGFTASLMGTTQASGELFKNPRLVDAANGDYRLSVGSPAINSGEDLSGIGINTDFDGNSRPLFHAYDIGAYEYSSSNGSFRVLEWSESNN